MTPDKKLILLDSNSLINRAFYALPPLVTKEGLYTNGVMGFISMLQKLIAEQKPTHICAVFDCRAKTFRHEMYEEYKATRKPMSPELAMQIPVLKELLTLMGIKILFKEGAEGDDIIGTLSKRFSIPTIIVSGDRDTLQLVDETTTVFNTHRGVSDVKVYNLEILFAEGFTPKQIIDYKGLAGDSSDNIPGAEGVGDKTAITLLAQYGSIEGIYEHITEIKGKLQDKLMSSKDRVYLSRELATINTNIDIECTLDDLKFIYPIPSPARDYMLRLEFRNLISRFEFDDNKAEESAVLVSLNTELKEISTKEELIAEVKRIPRGSKVCVVWDNEITLAFGNKELKISVSNDLFGTGVTEYDVAEIVTPLFSADYKNIFFDAKQNFYILKNFGIKTVMPYEDVLLKAYLLNPNKVIKSASQLLTDYGFSGEHIASEILAIDEILDKSIEEKELTDLYYNIELPLIECLYDMEQEGFRLDLKVLDELDAQYTSRLAEIIKEVYKVAGEEFNINSTKQLSDILFNKLGLLHGKKTKTGLSVSAEVLEELEHPIIDLLLEYRTLAKLKSTYVDGMRSVLNKASGRVHTVFKQCLTATGRLSSTEPNLQNIPVRKEEGREIRRMFVPGEGGVLVSADYSQIELRLLAHFSQDEHLVNAYRNNLDIHRLTASKIFNTPFDEVDDGMRSSAKAVNFGIIYGISSFGLAKNAHVSNYQARCFIDEYFKEYPAVKKYMDDNVNKAIKQGYLRTLMGRIRNFPELASPKYNIKEFGKRAAMNMPLQGSASDIIKIAMLKVNRALKENNLKAKLILQVHDELILDVPIAEEARVKNLLIDCMENAVQLTVPLTVSVSSGKNWYEAK
ncbi:MAG TPA: DNA polymerase I [Clostridia bacterium]|nr:DNA polymerase I [Clostridia bacterium]